MSFALQALVIFILVFGIGALGLWLVRRFGSERLPGAARGRQPRLAVLDQAAVDNRRRLVLIRRDNVEHLILIGGPTDVVIEPHIVRAAAAPREAAPRPLPAGEALPRALPLGEGNMWPLQPETAPRAEPVLPRPEPLARAEPMSPRSEPPVRLQRPAPPPVQAQPEQGHRMAPEPEPPPPPPARERQGARQEERAEPRHDPLSGLAEELGRAAATASAVEPPVRAPRREPRARPTPASAGAAASSDGRFGSSADQNLAEMAQRLEAALRRPGRGEDARPAPPPKLEPKVDVKPEAQAEPEPGATAEGGKEAAAPAVEPPAVGASPEPRATRGEGKPAQQKSLYDSLEQEMASLLGRPADKA